MPTSKIISHAEPEPRRRIALAGGGTSGHVRAALAVGEAYRQLVGDVQILQIGARQGFRFETRLIPGANEHLELIDARPVMGMGAVGAIRAAGSLGAGIVQARHILRRNGTQLVVGFGGYATPAAILAAVSLGLATAIHEPNVVPGRANRLLRRFAAHVFLGAEDTELPWFSRDASVVGYPIGSDIAALMDEAHAPPDLARRPARILITGGSLGSTFLNKRGCELMAILRENGIPVDVVHQTGEAEKDAVSDAYARIDMRARVSAYVDDMVESFRWADFVISTAGAGTLAEIAVAGLPALIVPLSWVSDDHQSANARSYAAVGGVWLVSERDWHAPELAERIAALLRDPGAWKRAAASLRSLARPGAAMAIARRCEELVGAAVFAR
jgi:UDP-N-acetylglucosamine--N-acetylmuramyl-(pentapeptide) pyrophosphoryl-undecaprenol N-acetylglucosamine transferase